jgi:hypothetical protein
MRQKRNACIVLMGKQEEKKPPGRPRRRWEYDIVTDLINALTGNNSVNTVYHAIIYEAVFSMMSAPSSGGTTELCNPLLGNGSVNTFAPIGPCYESGDIINNRDGVFRGVHAEELS